jgi:hypothetical protein
MSLHCSCGPRLGAPPIRLVSLKVGAGDFAFAAGHRRFAISLVARHLEFRRGLLIATRRCLNVLACAARVSLWVCGQRKSVAHIPTGPTRKISIDLIDSAMETLADRLCEGVHFGAGCEDRLSLVHSRLDRVSVGLTKIAIQRFDERTQRRTTPICKILLRVSERREHVERERSRSADGVACKRVTYRFQSKAGLDPEPHRSADYQYIVFGGLDPDNAPRSDFRRMRRRNRRGAPSAVDRARKR